MTDRWLEHAMTLVASRRLELELRGHSPRIAGAAVARAWGTAERKAAPIRGALRSEAFYDLLLAELAGAEGWCRQVQGQVVSSG